MKTIFSLLGLFIFSFAIAQNQNEPFCGRINENVDVKSVSVIGFGSCASQEKPQPILLKVVNRNPDVFCWLGDNIYGDTRSMKVMRKKYTKLGCKEEFRKLNEKAFFLSTWDDHDYGANDAGKEYAKKKESKEVFLDFWCEPESSERRNHEGIYHSRIFGPEGQRVQFIMLDTRSFRDPLERKVAPIWKNAYQPIDDTSKTILGAEQWNWLQKVLQEPAELRIVMSSIQFGITYNGWEAWANFPHEKQRFIDIIKQTKSNGVVFISGDVHSADFSKQPVENGYPLYDLTSSGITQEWANVEENLNRIAGKPYSPNNAGIIEIDWNEEDPILTFNIIDVNGTVVKSHETRLSELQF